MTCRPEAVQRAGEITRVGNRTECALLQLVMDMGGSIEALREERFTLRTHPFSSERKRMSTLVSPAPPGYAYGLMGLDRGFGGALGMHAVKLSRAMCLHGVDQPWLFLLLSPLVS